MPKQIVPPELYNRDYYLNDCDGFREYLINPQAVVHDKFKRVVKHLNIEKGMNVLDIGCGRGELVIFCAQQGANVLGLDYSKDAIALSRETVAKLPAEVQKRIQLEVAVAEEYTFSNLYDYVFMIETTEHMHDWQLRKLFGNLKMVLKPRGKIIITTPNLLYERYFEPFKRVLDIPFKAVKLLGRIPRGKYRPQSVRQFFKDVFRVRVSRGQVHEMMHCNVNTPRYMRDLLKDFHAQIFCEDHSINPLSLLLAKWFGRYLIVVASPPK